MEAIADNLLSNVPFYPDVKPYILIALPYINYAINLSTYLTSTILLPLISTLENVLTTSSASDLLTTIPILLAVLISSIYILGWVKRQIFFWIGLVFQLVFYGGIIVVGLLVWSLGPQRCMDILMGWYSELAAAKGAAGESTGIGQGRGIADKMRGKGNEYVMGSGRAGTGWR